MKKRGSRATSVVEARHGHFNKWCGIEIGKYFWWKISFLIIVLILAGFLVYANFFYYADCENQVCFNDFLSECRRARFVSEGEMVFEYKIEGRSGDGCGVTAKLLQGELNSEDSTKLINKEMKCLIEFGVVIAPESEISECHGELKEGLQELLISKLHTYIVQNLGKINEDLFG